MRFLHFIDWFFIVFHACIVLFNLFGWIWQKTRKANLVLLLLTAASWLGLGIFYGLGYCPLTDWHWKILAKLGVHDLPNSYITYLIFRISSVKLDDDLVINATGIIFALALLCSIIVNVRSYNSKRNIKK
jgi:hypothetical protein